MAIEIERRFLVASDSWRQLAGRGQCLVQGYISHNENVSIRVRRADDRASLTIKGKRVGLARLEYEFEIPPCDAQEMLSSFCGKRVLEKVRYHVLNAGQDWEIDVFSRPIGLVLAEIELTDPDQPICRPEWLGDEVTHDDRFRSSALIANACLISSSEPVANTSSRRMTRPSVAPSRSHGPTPT